MMWCLNLLAQNMSCFGQYVYLIAIVAIMCFCCLVFEFWGPSGGAKPQRGDNWTPQNTITQIIRVGCRQFQSYDLDLSVLLKFYYIKHINRKIDTVENNIEDHSFQQCQSYDLHVLCDKT